MNNAAAAAAAPVAAGVARLRRPPGSARPHVLRLSSMQDADIVIAEFAMNDGTQAACKGDGSGSVPARASFERLIRKLQVGRRETASDSCGCLCICARAVTRNSGSCFGCWWRPSCCAHPAVPALADRAPAGAAQPAGGDCDGRVQLCAWRGGLLPQGEAGSGARRACACIAAAHCSWCQAGMQVAFVRCPPAAMCG